MFWELLPQENTEMISFDVRSMVFFYKWRKDTKYIWLWQSIPLQLGFVFTGWFSSSCVWTFLKQHVFDLLRDSNSKNGLGGGFEVCFIFTPILREDSRFDEHIFQMGWFNQQLDEPEQFGGPGWMINSFVDYPKLKWSNMFTKPTAHGSEFRLTSQLKLVVYSNYFTAFYTSKQWLFGISSINTKSSNILRIAWVWRCFLLTPKKPFASVGAVFLDLQTPKGMTGKKNAPNEKHPPEINGWNRII